MDKNSNNIKISYFNILVRKIFDLHFEEMEYFSFSFYEVLYAL